MGKTGMAMKTIACVLKTGVWRNRHLKITYRPDHVVWLKKMVDRFCSVDHRFICLTDTDIPGVETIPLADDLPGWWSKMELFREFDDCFYLDLDTVLTGDISGMVQHPHRFSALRNLSSKVTSKKMGSGVMAWSGEYRWIYDRFMDDPPGWMSEFTTSDRWGDQGFICEALRGDFDRLQDIFPGAIVSQKFGLKGHRPTPETKIVCFHGTPKPWEIRAKWIPEL